MTFRYLLGICLPASSIPKGAFGFVCYLGLEPALQEVLDLEAENVIELHSGLVEDADADETTEKGIAWKQRIEV